MSYTDLIKIPYELHNQIWKPLFPSKQAYSWIADIPTALLKISGRGMEIGVVGVIASLSLYKFALISKVFTLFLTLTFSGVATLGGITGVATIALAFCIVDKIPNNLHKLRDPLNKMKQPQR